MTYTMDVEMFIYEVKKYPEIWDTTHADHKFMRKKQAAWEEIAKVFITDFDEMSSNEKYDVLKKLNSKWRNIRDSFVRSSKRNKGNSAYMYAKHLSFLYNLYSNSKTGSDSEDTDDKNSSSEEGASATKKIRYNNVNFSEDSYLTTENLKRKRSPQDAIEYVETPLLSDAIPCNAPEDEDKSFFDSLLPAVRPFSVDQKLEFRSEVILLIKKIRNSCADKKVIDFESAFQ